MKKRFKGWVGKERADDLKYYFGYVRLLNVWSDRPQTRYVIVTQSRCGTGLLATLMGQHPDILTDGEVFNKNLHRKVRSPGLFLKARSKRAIPLNKKIYGFKLKYHHLVEHQGLSERQAERFILDLYREGWKFIYLRRNNLLRRSLSGVIANTRRLRHVRGGQALTKTHVDAKELMREIDLSERLLAIDERHMAQVEHLLIEYENELLDATRHVDLCARIFDFLGVPAVTVTPSYLEKTSADDLSLTIENYAEIETLLRDSPHAQSLKSHLHYMPAAAFTARDRSTEMEHASGTASI